MGLSDTRREVSSLSLPVRPYGSGKWSSVMAPDQGAKTDIILGRLDPVD